MAKYQNHYECPGCGTTWYDYSDGTQDDRCPKCEVEVKPDETVDLPGHDRGGSAPPGEGKPREGESIMESAKPIDDAFVPVREWQENHGARRLCLDFHYDAEVLPYREWPRALAYKGVTYVRTGYNSDANTVHYKQGEVATPAG